MKRNIMKRAWEIRREAAKNHGCKVSEILMSDCLKMAWHEAKNPKKKERKKGMNYYKTIEEARVGVDKNTVSIIEFDHVTDGRCYARFTVSMAMLKMVLAQPKNKNCDLNKEMVKIIKEHNPKTAEQIKKEKEEFLKNHTNCERCGCKIDGNKSKSKKVQRYFNGSKVNATVWYCDTCATLLNIMADRD